MLKIMGKKIYLQIYAEMFCLSKPVIYAADCIFSTKFFWQDKGSAFLKIQKTSLEILQKK